MTLSVKPTAYRIPEYSLTGDLLAFMTCSLQYRMNSKGSLPPSTPVQLWFGEFIHGVMGEGYLRWRDNGQRTFPWSTEQINDVAIEIAGRLAARGLYPYSNVFCWEKGPTAKKRGCPDANHPHELIANKRAIASVNTWGPSLYPLIDSCEVRLDGLRPMPNYVVGTSRSPYYSVTGVADVISSVQINEALANNEIIRYLNQDPLIQKLMSGQDEFEIVIEYKGMRRPGIREQTWQSHEWQLMTYMWLREQQLRAQSQTPRAIVGGVIFYLNELEPSITDNENLKANVQARETDIVPSGADFDGLMNSKDMGSLALSSGYRMDRSMKVIPYDTQNIQNALRSFDNVVDNIESRVLREMGGTIGLRQCWKEDNPLERNCTACDQKTICTNPAPRPYPPTVP